MPSVMQAAGGCGCVAGPACAVAITGNVKGCGSLNLVGATVEAHDATAGGPLLGTTTTDAAGNYALAGLAGTIGHVIVVVFTKSPRFTQATTTLTYSASFGTSTQWSCGKTSAGVNRTLAAAAGYRCTTLCADPLATTLILTDGRYGGPVTLTFGGTNWNGTQTVAFPGSAGGCGGCAADAAVPVQYGLDGTTGALSVSCRQLGGCPDHTGAFAGMAPRAPTVLGCPPALTLSYSIVPSGSAFIDALYNCTSPTTHTVTE